MQLDVKKTNKILIILAIIIIVGGGIWSIFLNEAQRMVVYIGIALCVINLLGLSYFFNRNLGKRK